LYPKLIVLVMLTDVFLTAMVGLGVYFGFAIHPIFLLGNTQSPVQTGIHGTIPLWMPSIQDLKVPFSYLPYGGAVSVWRTIAVSAAIIAVQSYARAVYLGGLRSAVLQERPSPLREYGRRYFKRMLGWSVLYAAVAFAGMMLAMWAWPIGAAVFLFGFFYSLVPYLIVLRDYSLSEAISAGPSIFRAHFRSMVPFALLALFLTAIVSIVGTLDKPLDYYLCMLLYSTVGTLMIGEFMRRLHEKMNKENGAAVRMRTETIPISRLQTMTAIALLFVVPVVGVYFSAGYPIRAADRVMKGDKTELSGVSFQSGFSDAMYASDQTYNTYEWQPNPYRIRIAMPDMSEGRSYSELRGTATVYWDVSQENVTRSGNSSAIRVVNVPMEQTIVYRLVRERSEDGSFYYSSRDGAASILALKDKAREPMSLEMTVSGDGRHVFVMQYPSRFEAGSLFRVSADGRFFVPRASKVNPGDFDTYWFASEWSKEDVFAMVQSKNEHIGVGPKRLFVQLAAALQEADGAMVKKQLQAIGAGNAQITAPDWTERQWTDYLRKLYEPAEMAEMLGYMTKAGVQNGHETQSLSPPAEQAPAGNGGASAQERQQTDAQRPMLFGTTVPFPDRSIVLVYEIDKTDKLLSLEIRLEQP
jgi:hypothetical protein